MIIAPSLLAADFGRFGHEAARTQRSDAEWLHLDIMDGHFVPNISFGPEVVRAVRPVFKRFLDVHLMCSKPEILIESFAKAGADQLTIHIELGDRVEGLLWKIRSLGLKVGLAVNPPTNINLVLPYLNKIDLLLVMTVNPGFGGQSFISECVPKVQVAAAWRKQHDYKWRIEVDGGINNETAAECALAGADTFVAGTSLFKQPNLTAAVNRMRRAIDMAIHPGAPLRPLRSSQKNVRVRRR